MPTTPVERIVGSDGVASLAANTNLEFDFSAVGDKRGNRIIISCEAGGLFRVSWDDTEPSTTITTAEATSRWALCDGNEVVIDIDRDVSIINLHCKSAVTNLGVTLVKA